MLLNIILIAVIAISLGVVIFLVVRKFPRLKTLDIETVPQAQRAKMRDRILLERMKRKTQWGTALIKKGAAPVFQCVRRFITRSYKRVCDLEKKYQKEATNKTPLSTKGLASKLDELLQEAVKLIKQENFSEAEKKCIEIISLSPKNIEAYRHLSEIYLKLKEYKQAAQTSQFILKLIQKQSRTVEKQDEFGRAVKSLSNASEVAGAHINLGYVYQLMEKPAKAFESYEQALAIEPNNPRNLDLTLEMSIMLKNKSRAADLLKRLEEVNPENQKLKDYREKVLGL